MNADPPRRTGCLAWIAALFPTLGLIVAVAAIGIHRSFVAGLDDDHAFRGGTALAMVFTMPAISLAAVLGVLGLVATLAVVFRSHGRFRGKLWWYTLLTTLLLWTLRAPFLPTLVPYWSHLLGSM